MESSPRYLYANEFHNLFGVFLADFWDKLFGFDVCKFDEVVQPPDGESLKAFIGRKYGERAVFIVDKLVGYSPLLARR
jgi:hypothetical protein